MNIIKQRKKYGLTVCYEPSFVWNTQAYRKIYEHVPLSLEKALKEDALLVGKSYSSAIAEHLVNNRSCGANYNKDMFTIINTARSKLQLNILEALHIMHDRPVLCRQKQFVYGTLLFKSNGW